jgi:hypothetical protein
MELFPELPEVSMEIKIEMGMRRSIEPRNIFSPMFRCWMLELLPEFDPDNGPLVLQMIPSVLIEMTLLQSKAFYNLISTMSEADES